MVIGVHSSTLKCLLIGGGPIVKVVASLQDPPVYFSLPPIISIESRHKWKIILLFFKYCLSCLLQTIYSHNTHLFQKFSLYRCLDNNNQLKNKFYGSFYRWYVRFFFFVKRIRSPPPRLFWNPPDYQYQEIFRIPPFILSPPINKHLRVRGVNQVCHIGLCIVL